DAVRPRPRPAPSRLRLADAAADRRRRPRRRERGDLRGGAWGGLRTGLDSPCWTNPGRSSKLEVVETTAAVSELTTTEAAVLALLAIEGERSGYDLLKLATKSIGHVWTPARS